MTSARVKKISTTLAEVRDSHRFLKVTVSKDGSYNTSRVQINGHTQVWVKDPKVVYSPETGLAGRSEDIIEYLKSRADRSDDSAEDVLRMFETDKHIITKENVAKHKDYIDNKMHARTHNDAEPMKKLNLVPREKIPDLLARAKEARSQLAGAGKVSKADVIGEYIKKAEATGKVYRIHGCSSDGLNNGDRLRSTTRDGISTKNSVLLGTTAPLNHFVVPASYDNKRYVVNFMTLYYMYADKLKTAEAQTRAKAFAEELLVAYKKVRGAKRSPSPRKSRSSSPASSTSAKPKAKRSASGSSRSASPAKRVSSPRPASARPARSARATTPAASAKSRSPSPPSTVQSKGSPTRSRQASTSPAPKTVTRKTFAVPSKKQ